LHRYNSLITRASHHPIQHTAMTYFAEVVQALMTAPKPNKVVFESKGTVQHNGYTCHRIDIYNNDYTIENFTINHTQTLTEFADAHYLNPYKLKELTGLDLDDKLKAGQTIKKPTHYAQSLTLLINQATNLPVKLTIKDEKGLFEDYEYLTLDINQNLSTSDFEFK